MAKKTIGAFAIGLFLTAILSGCISLRIAGNVKDPSADFDKAYAQIQKIEKSHPNRVGRPGRLCLLVYDGSEQQLVKLSFPMWIVNACLDAGLKEAEGEGDFDIHGNVDLDWQSIKDLSQIGPGLLLEVVEENERVLIWLK